ncbi:hypothetical protein BO78DRAFT_330276 [Aspergillus sclerotiicarbonarius CBS 121057]|uniref:F-box domain-containing protein n=1 Tax=Aspergillus sclerotiicarbonarius (strain CBS 121057 / IBT 28362) TaxID=1448318 RepID=A0A319DRP2_ASPSB|nr:hypothetical protein BO78DRAFT_330276 [Aspergillus sclerotiicarbonarius CBS 121057]
MLQPIFPQLRSNTALRKIPPELVEMVFAFLPVQDQICFGLSCKYIFTCLNSYLETHQIQLRQLLPREERVMLCPNVKRRPRIQLLLRLENDHWRYCSDCWTLHPHSTWLALQSLWKGLQRRSCSECQLLQGQMCCMPYAGKVDICPCVSITFRDKLHLMQMCKDARKVVPPGTKNYNDNALLPPGSSQLLENLRHECNFTDHPFISIRVKTEFWIIGKSMGLCVLNHYKFETRHETPSTSLKSLLTCPHKDTGNWVRRVFHEGGSSFTGWDKNRSTRPYTFKITTLRNLGNSKWPNRAWSRNCYS